MFFCSQNSVGMNNFILTLHSYFISEGNFHTLKPPKCNLSVYELKDVSSCSSLFTVTNALDCFF